jgi:LPXTG-motif cell wall-anchored protein
MKYSIKRISALLLAVIFAIMMPLTAFATTVANQESGAEDATNSSDSIVEVTKANAYDSLSLYKIINAEISDDNTLDYSFTTDFANFLMSKTEYKNLTIDNYIAYQDDATALKQLIGDYTAYIKENSETIKAYDTKTADEDGVADFLEVGIGQYIVVATGSSKGAYVYGNNTVRVIPHTEGGKYKIWGEYDVEMKSSTPTVSKTIVNDENVNPTTNSTGGTDYTATVGKPVTFKVEVTIPTYPAGAVNKTLFLADKPSAGLTIDPDSVELYTSTGTKLTNAGTSFANNYFTSSYENGTLYVDLNYDNLKSYTEIYATYKAYLNENAVIGTTGNPNRVDYVYTNSPFVGKTYDPDKDDPEDTSDDRPDPSKDDKYSKITSTATVYTYGFYVEKVDSKNSTIKLAGAEFEIYADINCKDYIGTITTDDNGYAAFDGVASGTIYLKETKAPAGYEIPTDNVSSIEINTSQATKTQKTVTTVEYTENKDESLFGVQATDENGNLLYFDYDDATSEEVGDFEEEAEEEVASLPLLTLNLADDSTATEEAEYTLTTTDTGHPAYIKTMTTTVDQENGQQATNYVQAIIKNKAADSKSLPGTGGIGIVPFVAVGSVLMIGATIILVTRRRMSDSQENC